MACEPSAFSAHWHAASRPNKDALMVPFRSSARTSRDECDGKQSARDVRPLFVFSTALEDRSSCSCSSFDSPLWFRRQACDGSRDECAYERWPFLVIAMRVAEKKHACSVRKREQDNVTNEKVPDGSVQRDGGGRKTNETDPCEDLTLQNYSFMRLQQEKDKNRTPVLDIVYFGCFLE